MCAMDCGHVVKPAGVEQQIKSGMVFGLSAALKERITIEQGHVVEGSFHQYDVLRIDEMPVVEVHIVPSQAAPGGIGEAALRRLLRQLRMRCLRRRESASAGCRSGRKILHRRRFGRRKRQPHF